MAKRRVSKRGASKRAAKASGGSGGSRSQAEAGVKASQALLRAAEARRAVELAFERVSRRLVGGTDGETTPTQHGQTAKTAADAAKTAG